MPDIVIIGSGVFGVWTAHHLLAAGASVTIVDAYGPGNSRSSSGDESRILRCGYGTDEIYTRMARRSLGQWQALESRQGGSEPLWHASGVLWMAAHDDAYAASTRATLAGLGYPVVTLDRAAMRAGYPHLVADDVAFTLLEPDCGVIMARRAVRTLAGELRRRGATVRRGRVVAPAGSGRPTAVSLAGGEDIAGDQFVFACGAWLPTVFPDTVGLRIRPTRQTVVYFGVPPGDDRFGPSQTPAWVDFPSAIYGVPDLDGRGLKVGIDRHGEPFDPDGGDRGVDQESVERARAWLRRRFPALADAPVLEGRVCQYENTSTGDFLIDRHPEFDNVWIVGGGSGHGFKHGPAVGEYAAQLIAGDISPEPRFTLRTKGTEARRAIY